MKNLSIRAKLLLLSIPALVVLVAISSVFIWKTEENNKLAREMLYDELYVPGSELLNADRDFYQAFLAEEQLELAAISSNGSDTETLKSDFEENAEQTKSRVEDACQKLQQDKALYENYRHATANVTFQELKQQFDSGFESWYSSNSLDGDTRQQKTHLEAFNTTREYINLMTEILDAYAEERTAALQSDIKRLITISVSVVVLAVVALVILAVIMIRYLRGSILYITNISKRIASGELALTIDKSTFTQDETGQLSQAMGMILERLGIYSAYISEISRVLDTIKDGDLRVSLNQEYEGEFSSVKEGLLGISASLNKTLSLISTAAERVNFGSAQVSNGAQALAAGATEQAASVEQLSASVTTVAQQALENSKNVKLAAEYVEKTAANVIDGREHMKQLSEAMENIGSSSKKIASITKVIEDIAFQTNILALNAAIEAARAGSSGKGFAVVADEVRNLAGKSSEAAKQTADLIAYSVTSVAGGSRLTEQTVGILQKLEDNSQLVNDSIIKIDAASSEQALAIEQIMQGLSQVSAVIQTNAASAEENSTASEEMTAQAISLRTAVKTFKLDNMNT